MLSPFSIWLVGTWTGIFRHIGKKITLSAKRLPPRRGYIESASGPEFIHGNQEFDRTTRGLFGRYLARLFGKRLFEFLQPFVRSSGVEFIPALDLGRGWIPILVILSRVIVIGLVI